MDDPPGGDGSEAGLLMISQVRESRCPGRREEKPVRLVFCLPLTVESGAAARSVYMARWGWFLFVLPVPFPLFFFCIPPSDSEDK